MTLGERIKKVRREVDLTQQKFCERIGFKQNSISLIYNFVPYHLPLPNILQISSRLASDAVRFSVTSFAAFPAAFSKAAVSRWAFCRSLIWIVFKILFVAKANNPFRSST